MDSKLREIQDIINSKGERTCVAVFANKARIAGFSALACRIAEKGHLTIFLYQKSQSLHPTEQDFLKNTHAFGINAFDISELSGLDVVIWPDHTSLAPPPGATMVGIYHSLPELDPDTYQKSGHAGLNPYVGRIFDYITLGRVRPIDGSKVSDRISDVYPEPLIRDRRTHLDVVPAGHPKIDYLTELVNFDEDKKYIVYSPTSVRTKQSRLREYGFDIVSSIHKNFPDYQVVVRPYPNDESQKIGKNIVDELGDSDRIIFDDSRSGIDYFRHAALVVTDRSSVALSFALATGRPYISVDMKEQSTWDSGDGGGSIRKHAKTMSELNESIEDILNNAQAWREKIMAERGEYVYNPGGACKYIAESIPVFARRESKPEWVSAERRPWKGFVNERECQERLDQLKSHVARRRKVENTAFGNIFQFICDYHNKSFFILDEINAEGFDASEEQMENQKFEIPSGSESRVIKYKYTCEVKKDEEIKIDLDLISDKMIGMNVRMVGEDSEEIDSWKRNLEIGKSNHFQLRSVAAGRNKEISIEMSFEDVIEPTVISVNGLAIESGGRGGA